MVGEAKIYLGVAKMYLGMAKMYPVVAKIYIGVARMYLACMPVISYHIVPLAIALPAIVLSGFVLHAIVPSVYVSILLLVVFLQSSKMVSLSLGF